MFGLLLPSTDPNLVWLYAWRVDRPPGMWKMRLPARLMLPLIAQTLGALTCVDANRFPRRQSQGIMNRLAQIPPTLNFAASSKAT